MTLFDLVALGAVVLTAYLFFLLLFEPGIRYRIRGPLHACTDEERLQLFAAVLSATPQTVDAVELLGEGTDLYRSQLEAIRSAQESVHLEAYIFYPGPVAEAFVDALTECARRSVRVRVTLDAFGSFRTRPERFTSLQRAGGSVVRYHPLSWRTFRRLNSRTHRNLLIIDGRVAFVGGAGISDHWSRAYAAPWRDCIVRVSGEVVRGLQGVFAENWLEASGELLVDERSFPIRSAHAALSAAPTSLVVGSTPTAGLSTRARVLIQLMLASARQSIELSSPYFIPDLGIRRELCAARKRGVRVRVLTGGRHGDHLLAWRAGRRRYGPLLAAGVEIFEYAPRMMHVKALIVDGCWSVLGSTNIDHRSFGLNDEVNVLLLDPKLARSLQSDFETDLTHSTALDYRSWLRRSWRERVLATAGRLLERHQ